MCLSTLPGRGFAFASEKNSVITRAKLNLRTNSIFNVFRIEEMWLSERLFATETARLFTREQETTRNKKCVLIEYAD